MVVKEFLNEDHSKVWKWIKRGAISLVGAIGLWTSFYIVNPESTGVVRRFGEFVRTTNPGIHFKLPYRIEKVGDVPVRKVQIEEFGFRTKKAGVVSEFEDMPEESSMLTGDLSMADIEWSVQWNIKDPIAYSFNVKEPQNAIRDCSHSVMRGIIGNGSVDEAITIGRIDYQNSAKLELQELLDKYNTGINIISVNMQSTHPPLNVRPAFNEVNESLQQREKRINEARQEYNREVPQARGEAQRVIEVAYGYGVNRINTSLGDVAKFEQIYTEYKQAPEITRQRMYLEAMATLLPKIRYKWIIEQRGAEGGLLLKLDLEEPEK